MSDVTLRALTDDLRVVIAGSGRLEPSHFARASSIMKLARHSSINYPELWVATVYDDVIRRIEAVDDTQGDAERSKSSFGWKKLMRAG